MKLLTKLRFKFGLLSVLLLGIVNQTLASIIQLDFEGVGSQAQIIDFYNGGTDSLGNSGVNYGIEFGSNTLGLTESEPLANFSGQPSGETVMFFLSGTAILNYAPGFDTGFSFYYTTVSFTGSVEVFDGLNATGNLLGSLSINALGVGPDVANPFSNWEASSLGFAGIAKSINFGGTVNQVGYDNITFGSTIPDIIPSPPGTPVAAPSATMLLSLALIPIYITRKKRLKLNKPN